MERVFESKVTALKASKTRIYPTIRLPKEFSEIIGKKTEIYTTSYEGKLAFLVVVDHESLNKEVKLDLEKRISELEQKYEELYAAVFGKNNSENQASSGKSCSGRDLNPGRRLERPE